MNTVAKRLVDAGIALPDLENKLFFSIREVSEICGVEPNVLRYWETEFHQLKPEKWSGNRRRYRQRDIYLVLQIKHLREKLKFTISGVRKQIAKGEEIPRSEQQDICNQLLLARSRLLVARELLRG
ncbi:MAG: MerR family transcriptional regulator [Mariprofundales bacterium]|nr:MerR family transcriptional regulator [Mariprofundales bacterium]